MEYIFKYVFEMLQILHGLLKSSTNVSETKIACVIPTVLKTLRKLTRSLRFRIYYYCEPCVANKKQKVKKKTTYKRYLEYNLVTISNS